MRNANKDAIQKTKVAIIGAGFGGLAMAIRLLQSQINDFVILEKTNDVGGTWRENQYPGAACDVQSHMYSLSFAPKTDWSKRYAEADEIFTYIQDITEQYKLKNYCKFNHEVTHAEFDENRIQSTKLRDNKLEVESHYDGEIYHVNVSPLIVELTERNEVIESYSLVFKTAKEIADKIIDKLQSFSK